jgi:hypothetical protein
MEWTSDAVNVWFFAPDRVPKILLYENSIPDPETFGTPSATFSGPCSGSFGEKFFNHSIIIDTTFCGGWAGGAFGNGASSCPTTNEKLSRTESCVDYVGRNPEAFKEAWWGINSLKVWEKVPGFSTESFANESFSTMAPVAVKNSGGRSNMTKSSSATMQSSEVPDPIPANAAPSNDNDLPLSTDLLDAPPVTLVKHIKPTPKLGFI